MTETNSPQIWSVSFEAPLSDLPRYAFALETLEASLSWTFEDDSVTATASAFLPKQNHHTQAEIQKSVEKVISDHFLKTVDLKIEEVPNKNWLLENQKQFPPLTIGNFFIFNPIHLVPVPEGLMGIELNAALAFGSGEHATTHGCLIALQHLKKENFEPKSILDMGCGSGILAIAAARLWDCPILACDFDKFATQTARENADRNGTPHITVTLSDGFQEVPPEPFDLILANILSGPLISMAPDMAKSTTQGSRVILSGLLENQSQDVLKSYTKEGFKCLEHFSITGWSTLLLVKQ